RARPNISACTCIGFVSPLSSYRPHSAPSAALFSVFASVSPIPIASGGHSPASSFSWRCWVALRISLVLSSGRSATSCCRINCNRSRNTGISFSERSWRSSSSSFLRALRVSPCNSSASLGGGLHDRAAGNPQRQQILWRVSCARSGNHGGARGRTRVGGWSEWRRQDDAREFAYRTVGADCGRSSLHGQEYRRRRTGRPRRPRPRACISADPDFPSADRARDHRGGYRLATENALAVLGSSFG